MDNIIFNHSACKSEPINLMADFREALPQFPVPNVVGVRWSYRNALAKSLQELGSEIEKGLDNCGITGNPTLQVLVKDGGDGLGDVSMYKEKGDRYLEDKAYRYSFCVLKITVDRENERVVIWEEDTPGSVRTNKTLIEAVCDENQTAAMVACVVPVEREREQIANNLISVETGTLWRNFKVEFINSMEDEKRASADGGLQGAGSRFMCDLCYATQDSAKSDLGTFKTCRTLEETKQIAALLHCNPNKLTQSQLSAVAKGVKTHPVLNIEHAEHKVDTTHARINLGKFCYKLLIREIAGVTRWNETSDIKHHIEQATNQLNIHLKKTIGINPCLMLPGNYARILFSQKNESHILYLLKSDEKREKFAKLLTLVRFMHKIFSSSKPKEEFPEEWSQYKSRAVEFGKHLIASYPYARWSNYVHKTIEYVQEVIESHGTLGGFSGEGNEAGNKIFQHLRKNHSRKTGTFESVSDVLKMHWLYCSFKLKTLNEVARRKYKCSICKQNGHNCNTCPSAPK